MRGSDVVTGSLFSYVDLEDRIPERHPLRPIRELVNEVLASLSGEFDAMYSALGRPSIPPEKLLRGSLIQAFYTIRSERQLMEQLDYNLLFRWFVGLGIDDPVWDHSSYSKNRDRLLEADIAKKFLKGIVEHPKVAPLLSDEHFTVDGTLVQAWASMKSFVAKETPPGSGTPPPNDESGSGKPKESKKEDSTTPAKAEDTAQMQSNDGDKKSRNEEVDFHGQKRSNATHASNTDPEARLYRKGKGKEAKLSFLGHALAENRHGLIVETGMTQATGTAEREAAKEMIETRSPGSSRKLTLGADKAYDTKGFVADCRAMCVTPHVAQNTKGRSSAIDARTTRHAGYAVSQRKRKLIEEAFGWAKTIGGLDRPMRHGTDRLGFLFTFTMAAYDLVRLPKLIAAEHGRIASAVAA